MHSDALIRRHRQDLNLRLSFHERIYRLDEVDGCSEAVRNRLRLLTYHAAKFETPIPPISPASRRRIGVIFQQFNLVPRLSVLTNVLVGNLGKIPGWRGALMWFERDEKLRALRRVGIDKTARRRGLRSGAVSTSAPPSRGR